MHKTKGEWTKENIIDHIILNFKGKSILGNDNTRCAYRGDHGKKCAVGMFIPDELYRPTMDKPEDTLDDMMAQTIIDKYNLSEYMPLDSDAMRDLQMVHDGTRVNDYRSNDVILEEMVAWIEREVQ